MIWKAIEKAVYLASGEWILNGRANGGTVILVRSALIATPLWLFALAIRSSLAPGSTLSLDAEVFRREAREVLPWLGAIFAGAYAGLYTRFSAQWSYLAEFYNQMMQSQVQCPVTEQNRDAYTKWFVAFIDDAESLHLARKPAFASVIQTLLEKPGVSAMYAAAGTNCPAQLERLRRDVQSVVERSDGVKVVTRKPPAD
jgi:hypothetical protein